MPAGGFVVAGNIDRNAVFVILCPQFDFTHSQLIREVSMFKLELASRIISSPNIEVTWCLDRILLNWLKDKKATNVHVLLVTARRYGDFILECDRFLIPLEHGKCYVSVDDPGEYGIFAAVVWRDTVRALRKAFLGKESDGMWKMKVLDIEEQDFYKTVIYMKSEDSDPQMSACLDVEVPDGIFAKKPDDWKWVTRWLEGKPNQCRYRKQLPIAYLIQPIAVAGRVVFTTLLRLGYLSLLLFTWTRFRFIDFSVLWHPFQKSLVELHRKELHGYFDLQGYSVLNCDKRGDAYPENAISFLGDILWPGFYPFGFAGAVTVNRWIVSLDPWIYVPITILGVGTLTYAIYGVLCVMEVIEHRRKEMGEEEAAVREKTPQTAPVKTGEERRLMKQYEMFGYTVSCDAELLPDLRKKHLSLKAKATLLFADVKAEACKPYAS